MRTVATVHYRLLSQDEKQECTAKEAYEWTDGRATFLGGALEGAVELADGTTRVPRNSHPVYIYPGLMYGLRLCAAQQLRDDMLLAAAESLASQVTDEDRAVGAVYPSMKNIRAISVRRGDGFRSRPCPSWSPLAPAPNPVVQPPRKRAVRRLGVLSHLPFR